MKFKLFLLLVWFVQQLPVQGQTILPDSTRVKELSTGIWPLQEWVGKEAPEIKTGIPFVRTNTDWKFILAVFLLIYLAVFKLLFPKYIAELFSLFLRSNIKSKQIKDQLESDLLPSVLLNIYFAVIMGIFSWLVLQNANPVIGKPKLVLISLCIAFVAIVYLVKYVVIWFLGWLFSAKETASAYIFIVFFFNKVIGLLLMPVVLFLLLNGFATAGIIAISIFIISLLILYRYILSYISIQKYVQMHPFHFFLYLCTVEIMPLMLIYKGLMINYSKLI